MYIVHDLMLIFALSQPIYGGRLGQFTFLPNWDANSARLTAKNATSLDLVYNSGKY